MVVVKLTNPVVIVFIAMAVVLCSGEEISYKRFTELTFLVAPAKVAITV